MVLFLLCLCCLPARVSAQQRTLSELHKAVKNPEYAVRARAAREIGDQGQAALGSVRLLDRLLYDKASPVRRAAAGALARISGKQATKALRSAMGNRNTEVRRDVALGLQEAPDKNIRLLSEAILDRDTEAREHAVVALTKGMTVQILPLLGQAAATDEDGFVREKAMEGMRNWMESPHPTGTGSLPGNLHEVIEKGLQDPSDRVRREAIKAMAVLDPYRSVALFEPMIDDRSPDVRETLFETLGSMGGPRSVAVLEGALHNSQIGIRKLAVEALSKLGRPGFAGVIRALGDSSKEVRSQALGALPNPLPVEAISPVAGLCQDPEIRIRVEAIERLVGVTGSGLPEARKTIRSALRDHSPEVRTTAVKAAAKVFQDEVVDVIREIATDDDLVVFRTKLEVLAAPKTSRSAVVLANLLAERQAGVFRELILDLILGMPKFAAGALVSVLQNSPEPGLEKRIVEILGGLGDPRPAPELLAILEDTEASDPLRIAAAKSLTQLKYTPALEAMESFWVNSKHLSPSKDSDLLRAIHGLGGSPKIVLLARRFMIPIAGVLALLAFLVAWHKVLQPRLANQMEEKESQRLKDLEAQAKEPKRVPTEDEFLEELNQKLQAAPARSRKIRYMIQRGLIHYVKMDYEKACTDLGQVTRMFQKDDDPSAQARVFFFLGKAALGKGDKQTGQRRLSDALRHHDKRLLSDVMSEIAQDPGDIEGGIAKLEEHLPFDDDINVVDIQKLKLL
jgi:HEAT repeat protein